MAVSVTNATGARGLENVHHDHNAAALPLQDAARQGARPRLTELQSTALSYLADVKSGGETVFPCACNYKDEQCARVQKACKLLYEAGVLFVRGDEGTHQSFKLTKPNEKAAKVVANAAAVVRNASRALCSGHAGAPGLRVAPPHWPHDTLLLKRCAGCCRPEDVAWLLLSGGGPEGDHAALFLCAAVRRRDRRSLVRCLPMVGRGPWLSTCAGNQWRRSARCRWGRPSL